ncbi:hypothetical protein ACOMHN_066904 [Nucella lapillus]
MEASWTQWCWFWPCYGGFMESVVLVLAMLWRLHGVSGAGSGHAMEASWSQWCWFWPCYGGFMESVCWFWPCYGGFMESVVLVLAMLWRLHGVCSAAVVVKHVESLHTKKQQLQI